MSKETKNFIVLWGKHTREDGSVARVGDSVALTSAQAIAWKDKFKSAEQLKAEANAASESIENATANTKEAEKAEEAKAAKEADEAAKAANTTTKK